MILTAYQRGYREREAKPVLEGKRVLAVRLETLVKQVLAGTRKRW